KHVRHPARTIPVMHYRRLARTGLVVSELCLGTMTFAGRGFWTVVGSLGQAESEALVGQAFEGGINFVDTADVYSEGESERQFGQALKNLAHPREEVIVATKCRGRMGPGPNNVGLSRRHILAAVDASLTRLQLDHIDLYQIHGVDAETPLEETMDALNDVVRSGKVRYIGFCNHPAWMAMKAQAIADAHGWTSFISAQVYYSIAGRDIERELVPFCQDQGLAILPWSPLAGGLLSGKFDVAEGTESGPEGARRSKRAFPPVDTARAEKVITAMRTVATETDESVARIALAWLLTRPFVTSIIIGANTPAQLTDNLGASEVVLSPEQIAALDAASALPPEYPGWMIANQAGGRVPSATR
ncbi:MAG: aldo/keto reductase, partial [bacterium]